MEKKKRNYETVEEYMTDNKSQVFGIADKIIQEIENKIEGAPLNQLTSALGTILDKLGEGENSEGLLAKVFEDFKDVK